MKPVGSRSEAKRGAEIRESRSLGPVAHRLRQLQARIGGHEMVAAKIARTILYAIRDMGRRSTYLSGVASASRRRGMTLDDVVHSLGERDAGLFVHEGMLCYAGPFLLPGDPLQTGIAANSAQLRELTVDGCYRLRVSGGRTTCPDHLPGRSLTGSARSGRTRGLQMRGPAQAATVIHTLARRSCAMLNAVRMACP
jgi:hypothetical protein